MSLEQLRCLERIAVGDTAPDLRLLLDLPVELGLARRHRDADTVNRIDRAGVAFHERVRDAYLRLAQADPARWAVIDAARSAEAVFADVRRAVESALSVSLDPSSRSNQV